MYKIFLAEDDTGISEAIKKKAVSWGFDIVCANDFRDIKAEFIKVAPSLVILDIGLPFFNGYHWCSEIRKISKVPIIFISSASDNINIVMAMNMGADDFIVKPFDSDVLIAKIQALLRRTYDFASSVSMMEHKGAVLDMDKNVLIYNEEEIPLTKNEYRILLVLMENRGKTVSREKLMESLWKTDSFIDENTLSVNVARLRKKLESVGLSDFISTKFGRGYIII